MDEAAYWTALEYRVCRELAGMRDKQLRAWWCDGFIPETFDTGIGCVTGRVWMGHGSDQEAWDFALRLGPRSPTRERTDWASLLPGEEVTGWLSMDLDRRVMTINPRAARPDGKPAPL